MVSVAGCGERPAIQLTNWIKSEAMNAIASGEDDHGGTAVEGIAGSNHLSSWLEEVSLARRTLTDLSSVRV